MNIHELRLLLTLNGNKRIPHLEEEIFANEELTNTYINAITANQVVRHLSIIRNICAYSMYHTGYRWPEAEVVIKRNRFLWQLYCDHFGIQS